MSKELIYAPLSQSFSNTDSEEDDDENHQSILSTDLRDLEESRPSDSTVIYSDRFIPLDETKNISSQVRNGRSSFNYSNDNIPIMVIDGQNNEKHSMSLIRRILLFASVLLCAITIIMFLYILPCNDTILCPSVEPSPSVSWEKTLDGVEFQGPITLIPGNPSTIIFLLKGQQFGKLLNSKIQEISFKRGGLISLKATNGNVLWSVVLKKLPANIDCNMLDVDKSGKFDCLVSGVSMLVSIDPLNGKIYWKSELSTHEDLPVLFADVNNDRINDLFTIEVQNKTHNLILLCGKTGKLLGRQIITPDCDSIKIDSIDNTYILWYTCYKKNNNKVPRKVVLKNFLDSLNLTENQQKLTLRNISLPHAFPYPLQSYEDTWELSQVHRLYVHNQGICPSENCKAISNLTLQNVVNETIIWSNDSPTSFVSKPAIIRKISKNFTVGFCLKFWHWNEAKTIKDSKTNLDIKQVNLTESINIIYENNTEVKKIIPSQNEVTQLCKDTICQPDLSRQVNSVLMTVLNYNGKKPVLINYHSTYNLNEKSQVLITKIQIVNLDY